MTQHQTQSIRLMLFMATLSDEKRLRPVVLSRAMNWLWHDQGPHSCSRDDRASAWEPLLISTRMKTHNYQM